MYGSDLNMNSGISPKKVADKVPVGQECEK